MASVKPGTDAYVAHMRGVKKAVREHRDEIARPARRLLREHRDDGSHRIRTLMEDTDGLVILEGPAALTLEFGRDEFTTDDGRYVGPMDPLNILGRAAGL